INRTLVIPTDKEQIEIHYTGLILLVSQRMQFKYKLVGFDNNWLEAANRRIAYYTRIPPGNYQFRVIACNNDGVWNDVGAELLIYVPTPIWRRWWAYILYMIAI